MVPACKGDDALNAPCDDFNDCSIDDKCIAVLNPTALSGVKCGGVASGVPCDDHNECSDEDKWIEVHSSNRAFASSILCRGEPAMGRPCNDGRDDTIDDICFNMFDGEIYCGGILASS
jgi:hypothetical protein